MLIEQRDHPCFASREKWYRRHARTHRTNNGRGTSRPLFRQRVTTFNPDVVPRVGVRRPVGDEPRWGFQRCAETPHGCRLHRVRRAVEAARCKKPLGYSVPGETVTPRQRLQCLPHQLLLWKTFLSSCSVCTRLRPRQALSWNTFLPVCTLHQFCGGVRRLRPRQALS